MACGSARNLLNYLIKITFLMFKKFILPLFFALTIATPSFSQSKNEMDDKISALTILKKYSETISCGSSFEEEKSVRKFLKNVYTVERDEEIGSATYFILWDGDIGCAGGSGTHSFIISEVGRDTESRPLLVKNDNAFGEEFSKKINSRAIEKIQQINSNKFLITSSEHGEKDANNFPSKKYQYTVDRVNYQWKVTGKKYLGVNNY